MKLSLKLQLSFLVTVLLAVIVASVGWYSMSHMTTQETIVVDAEDSVTTVLQAQLDFVGGINSQNTAQIQKSLTNINKITPLLQEIEDRASSNAVKTAVDTAQARLAEINPLVSQLIKDMNANNNFRADIRSHGDELEVLIMDLLDSQEQVYNSTMDPSIANFNFVLAHVAYNFGKVRQYYRDFVIRPTTENTQLVVKEWNATKQELAGLDEYDDTIDSKITGRLFQLADAYDTCVSGTVALTNNLSAPSAKALELANALLDDGARIAEVAKARFDEVRQSGNMILLITVIISLIVGIALAFLVTRSVVGQLGADPGELADVARRVSGGDYNIDDGRPHQGVFHDMVEMVATMKKTLDFSSGILKELPVPCAVFGTDNRLQFTNHRMLSLLELDGEPEKYIGLTSGSFMFRQEDYMTASRRCLNEKQGSNLRIPYTTAKNNAKHVNGIAAPIINRDGVLTNVISIWLDVTEETLNNQRIEAANANMQEVARELQQVATVASSTTVSLSETINQSGQGAQDQAERVSVTATALEEMNATVLEVARSAGTTSDSAASVKSEASNGSESMQVCVRAMHNVREESLKLKEEMNTLSSHAQAINEIMNVISDIADQTNLLALNAAIEAARAGDAGRGFAVVADEVRNLAEKTMTSTTDVGNAIAAIQKSTADNTRLVDGTVEKIENAAEMVAQVGEALLGIVDLADSTADQISSIATASEEQSSTSEEITRSIEEVNNIATANAASMGDAALAVSELVNQTQILADLVDRLHGTTDTK